MTYHLRDQIHNLVGELTLPGTRKVRSLLKMSLDPGETKKNFDCLYPDNVEVTAITSKPVGDTVETLDTSIPCGQQAFASTIWDVVC